MILPGLGQETLPGGDSDPVSDKLSVSEIDFSIGD